MLSFAPTAAAAIQTRRTLRIPPVNARHIQSDNQRSKTRRRTSTNENNNDRDTPLAGLTSPENPTSSQRGADDISQTGSDVSWVLDSGFRKLDHLYKVLVIGDAGVGKSSYINRYVYQRFLRNYKMTIGVDFALKVVKWTDDVTVKLQLWDIAGQERFTSMTRVYYKDAHACIIMFDLTNKASFLNAVKWKTDLDSKCTLQDGSNIPCILLANKCDLKHREIPQTEIESFCKEYGFIGWTEVSVKEGLMVEEAMKFLIKDMIFRYGEEPSSRRSSSRATGNSSSRDSPKTTIGSTVRLTGDTSLNSDVSKCPC